MTNISFKVEELLAILASGLEDHPLGALAKKLATVIPKGLPASGGGGRGGGGEGPARQKLVETASELDALADLLDENQSIDVATVRSLAADVREFLFDESDHVARTVGKGPQPSASRSPRPAGPMQEVSGMPPA